MKMLVLCSALLLGQMSTFQGRQVIRLTAPHDVIHGADDGKLVELINSPALIHLPDNPPKTDDAGNQWNVAIKNLGPATVTIIGKSGFSAQDNVGETVEIVSDGSRYLIKH